MNFGRELQDFVNAFQTGYSMFKSKDEREWEKEQRQMMRERHQWGHDDRDFREREFGFRMDESGRAHGRWEVDAQHRREDLGLRRRRQEIDLAKEGYPEYDPGGFTSPYDYGFDPEAPVPEGPEGVPLVQPMSYAPQSDRSALSRGGPQAEMVSARPQQRASARDIEDGEIRAYLDALASIESAGSGDYSAIGPTHRKLGRALGRYQVMEENVGPWSRQALGRAVTADEFIRNPEIQDAVAAYKFREYVDRFGDPALAAQAWFAGPGGVGTNRSDVLGTTVPEYARRFNSALSRNMARGGLATALPEDEDRVTPQGNPPLQYAQADRQAQLEALPVGGSLPPPNYGGGMEGQQEPPTNDRWEAARRSVRDGLNYAAKQSGFDINSAIDDPELEKLRQSYIRGYGAAPDQMMRQVQDKIDPERKMRPAERNMAAMAEVWKFYMDRGELDKAQKAAASMVQYHRRAFQQFSALARAALQGGDIDNATKAAVAAYANIPNGRDLSITKLEDGTYEVKITNMKDEEVVVDRIMHPDEFAAIAMGFSPATFEDELFAAAGAARPELDRMSPTERENAVALIKDFSEEYFGEDSPYNPQEQTGIRDIAADLIEHKGNGLDAERALRVAEGLLHPERNLADGGRLMEGGRASFDYERIPNSDLYQLDVNGRKYVVSSGTVIAIEKIRLKKLQEEQERQDLDDRRSERNKRVLDFIGRGMSAFDDYARLGVFGPAGMLGSALSDTVQDEQDKRRIPEIGARTTPKQGRLVPQGVLPE